MSNINHNTSFSKRHLWQLTRLHWVKNIRGEIDKVGNEDDPSTQENNLRAIYGEDSFVPSGDKRTKSRISKRGILCTKNLSLGGKLRARRFNGPIPTPTGKNDFRAIVPKKFNYHMRNNLLKNCENLPEVEPHHAKHSIPGISNIIAESSPFKMNPAGGGFKNPILDALTDIVGIFSDIISFGVGDFRELFKHQG
ncbi:MAG: hypothetical protein K8T10_05455 [Candidatus Eremiobacteraeota bacterium]|nr:hypothetical protein [Candidatus Eremiobacteraeota bacterium]